LTDSEILKRLEDIERKIVNMDGKLNRIERKLEEIHHDLP
jgi:tetrahydromethanopterin S-methyltransferase subunit G